MKKKVKFKSYKELKAAKPKSFMLVGGPYAGAMALLGSFETFMFSANGSSVGQYVLSGARVMIWKEDERR